jgi:hypothetical protein
MARELRQASGMANGHAPSSIAVIRVGESAPSAGKGIHTLDQSTKCSSLEFIDRVVVL